MMNPNDLIHSAKGLREEAARTLWYLHSRYIEDGFGKVADEIETAYSDLLVKIHTDSYAEMLDQDYAQGICRSELISSLNRFCTHGADACINPKLLNVFKEFVGQATAATKQNFHLTNIGSQVWETLDWCLEERRPCFIEGREGRGKTSAARAWYEAHRGEARYVSLPGLRTQRDFFDAIATAYGIPFSSKFPGEVRWRLKDIIVRSGLILILDEAHHALPERHKAGRPPLIDWIDCDLCNAGVPVVLVSTPQFGPMISEFEERTKWNAGQFRRRFSGRWTCLPDKTADDDLAALAKQAMPKVGAKGIDLAVGYAGTFGRDVSGLFDLVRDAERRARKVGHPEVTFQDLREAYTLDRVPSENAMANSFKRPSPPPKTPSGDVSLPEDGERAAAPLQASRTPSAEFTAPDRGASARLLVTS